MTSSSSSTITTTPSWAYDFCYYYLILAVVVIIATVWGVVQLYLLPGSTKRLVPTTGLALSLILSGAVTALLTMMEFWICRSALRPKTEPFAVSCSTVADCTTVTGTPQSDVCECGARGFCGGCTMRNNMEPSMLPAYSEPLAA